MSFCHIIYDYVSRKKQSRKIVRVLTKMHFSLSKTAVDLLRGLLERNYRKRLDLNEIERHDWIRNAPQEFHSPEVSHLEYLTI